MFDLTYSRQFQAGLRLTLLAEDVIVNPANVLPKSDGAK
tara:strand:- start:404 stop:520 length:117 start_codon:yes stop_codon:yes gene_type:complete